MLKLHVGENLAYCGATCSSRQPPRRLVQSRAVQPPSFIATDLRPKPGVSAPTPFSGAAFLVAQVRRPTRHFTCLLSAPRLVKSASGLRSRAPVSVTFETCCNKRSITGRYIINGHRILKIGLVVAMIAAVWAAGLGLGGTVGIDGMGLEHLVLP
jgi:hypothetical protein